MLIGFECFTLWQFGVVYFAGNSFSVEGRTVLPGSVASTAAVIAIGGICSVLSVYFLPRRIGVTSRVGLTVSLAASAALFFPLPEALLQAAFLTETFCCMLLFGNCFAVTILCFTEKSALTQAAVSVLFPGVFIAALHGGLFSVSFYEFALVSLLAQGGMLAAWLQVPVRLDVRFVGDRCSDSDDCRGGGDCSGGDSCCGKGDYYGKGGRETDASGAGNGRPAKKRRSGGLVAGLFALIFFATMIMQMGLNAAESVRFGLSVTYASSMAGALLFLYLWKRKRVGAFTAFSVFMSVACAGFILFLASRVLPLLTYAAGATIGFSFIMFSLIVYFGLSVFRLYPSRWVIAGFPAFVTIAMLVHSFVLEVFRSRIELLYTIYALAARTVAAWLQQYANCRKAFHQPQYGGYAPQGSIL